MSHRFDRQVRLPEVGEKGQQAIQNAKILIVGMGGLGCPSAQYLVAAGVGFLGIVDGDRVEESNLHRQILYSSQDVGKAKVEVAAKRLRLMNPSTEVNCHVEILTPNNAHSILESYDLVLDCTDNFEAKYLLNDICLQMGKVLVSASATGFEASLMVVGGEGPCLRCLYPQVTPGDVGSCNLTGILGAFVGIVGSWQAAEVLKLILIRAGQGRNFGTSMGRVLFFDFYTSQLRSVILRKSPDCFCAHKNYEPEQVKKESLYLTKDQVRSLREYVLIDVRSEEERKQDPPNGFEASEFVHIPYQEIVFGEYDPELWSVDKKYILFCSMGKRSAAAAQWLRDHGVQSAYSLRPREE